ncbi:MAG: S-adenosylmethionine-binding protein [Alphaproteobacteria bacterium]|nr:S-adenosylmethionine-binding protein [Alphaproteobacteria bacterium]
MTKPFPRGQYGVIYIDPPWKYHMWSEKGYEKSPEAHYPTMTFEEMAAMRDDILFATGPDAVMFMWTTWGADPDTKTDHLQQALDLMRLYGFERKTGGAWAKLTRHGKQGFGQGYIMRSSSEPFLIGTIGNPRVKHRSQRNQIFTGDVPENLHDLGIMINCLAREHSRKPDEVPKMLEGLFDGPYLEVFGRTERENWTVWGNETDKFLPSKIDETTEKLCRQSIFDSVVCA